VNPIEEARRESAHPASGQAPEPWIKRYRPTNAQRQMEAGIYGGIMLPPRSTSSTTRRQANWLPYKKLAPDIGLRFGYYPLSFLGLEVEGGVIPTKLRDDSKGAARHVPRLRHLQLPYRIAPFALIGFGVMGTTGSSARTSTPRCTSAAA
jgi:hypothetical protein